MPGSQEISPFGGNEQLQRPEIRVFLYPDAAVAHPRLKRGFYDFYASGLSLLSPGRAAPLHLRINPGKSCANCSLSHLNFNFPVAVEILVISQRGGSRSCRRAAEWLQALAGERRRY